jgi:CBS domain-containing protein
MGSQTVHDVMTAKVVAVRRDAGFKQMVDVLAEFKVSALPVIDRDLRVLGVVSEADLLHKVEFAGQDAHVKLLEGTRRRSAKAKAVGETAEDLMTSPAVTIGPDATIGEAARFMEARRVKRLPVVEDGRLVGIVSRRDLLRPYLRPDWEIRRDIVDDVLQHTLWVEPGTIDVAVERGRVTLRGKADRRSTAQIAARLAGAVGGVVAVLDELTWDFDDIAAARQRAGLR